MKLASRKKLEVETVIDRAQVMKRAASDLLDWYVENGRPLLWRETSDPYSILLSEIMSQQTRIEVVVPYYQRFVERWPSVEALAAAQESEVLAMWSGLGYYRRARLLLQTARSVVDRGGFPETLEGLLELPGIGPYTAAALGSIAFGLDAAVLDGNVERVTSRLVMIAGDVKRASVRRQLQMAANSLLVAGRPGESNQALMELGSQVCKPRSPICSDCPLADICEAHRAGRQKEFPQPRKKLVRTWEAWLMLKVEVEGRLLMVQRSSDEEVLADAWMLPDVLLKRQDQKFGRHEVLSLDSAGATGDLACRYGGRWSTSGDPEIVRHGITHRRLEVVCRSATVEGSLKPDVTARWCSPEEMETLYSSSLVKKVLSALV